MSNTEYKHNDQYNIHSQEIGIHTITGIIRYSLIEHLLLPYNNGFTFTHLLQLQARVILTTCVHASVIGYVKCVSIHNDKNSIDHNGHSNS